MTLICIEIDAECTVLHLHMCFKHRSTTLYLLGCTFCGTKVGASKITWFFFIIIIWEGLVEESFAILFENLSFSVPSLVLFLFSLIFHLFLPHSHTHRVFWEDVQLPSWEWLMTHFTAQTLRNQRCWGSVSARCPVWVITPGTQLIYHPTINPAVHTCCPMLCPSILL